MEPPPTSTATPTTTTTYPDSVDSSPRSRTTDSWAVDPTSDLLPQKLRLMCSYGGHIVPRPHDKSLCYVGGDTRMIVVDRQSTTLSSLSSHLSKTLLNNRPFTLKYQLPNEDLDSLITVSTDEDLDNMIEEYDRTLSSQHSAAHKPSRLRLFLFPLKPDTSQSIGPLLDSSTKSDDWFLSALNGAGLLNRGFSDSAPVNCLLGLDDDLGMNNTDSGSRDADVNSNSLPGSFGNEKSGKHSQDVHSVPDSPMLETTSSFGSTSSSPSIANLPPVRVATEERLISDQRLGIEEQFAQMVLGSNSASGGGGGGQKQLQQEEGYVVMSSGAITGNIPVTGMPVGVAPGDYSSRVYSDDERSDHGVPIGYRRLPVVGQQTQQQPQAQGQPPQVQSQQKSSGGLDLPSPDSVSSDGSLTNPLSHSKPVIYQEQVVQMPSGMNRVSANPVEQKINVSDPHAGLQLQQHIQEAGYVLQPQVDQRQPQQPQQQFIHAGAHYIHHATGSLPVAAYYSAYPSQHHQVHPHQLEQQYPVYYMPVSQGSAYNISAQQPNTGEPTSGIAPGRSQTPPNPTLVPQAAYNPVRNAPTSKPEMAANVYRMGAGGAPQLVQVPSSQHQQQQMYYTQQQQIHHQSQSVAPASGANATYAYEFTNPPHHQIYYTQPLAPTLPSQYQTINAANSIVLPDASGQIPTDNVKQQMRTSQPL